MSDFVVDTSAFVAILNNEQDALCFMKMLNDAISLVVSAATLHEAFCVVRRSDIRDGPKRLQRMIELTELEIAPFDDIQLEVSRTAYSLYGRGTGHPANLNMGDCFSYALAKSRKLPLLFKGEDFIHTDVRPALKPA